MQTYYGLVYVAMVLSLVCLLPIVCVPQLAKTVPINYIMLFGFTLGESWMVAFICTLYEAESVLIAALMTTGLTIGLTLYACFTKKDFSTMYGIMWTFLIAFILFGIMAAFFGAGGIVRILYCTFGIIIYGIYLVIDT